MFRTILRAMLSLCIAVPVLAQQDIQHAKDHPLVSRYKGSYIAEYHVDDYHEFEYPTGPSAKGRPPLASISGQITGLIYQVASPTDTVPQVFHNFIEAFGQAGFEPVFTCANMACGPDFAIRAFGWSRRHSRYGAINILNLKADRGHELAYWAGRHQVGDSHYVISLLVSQRQSAKKPVMIALDVVEERPLATGRVQVHPTAALGDAVAEERLNNASDVAGAKDHPLLSRYPGTFIAQYTVAEQQAFEFATGPRAKDQRRPPLESVAGRVTTILYETRSKRDSVTQVFANYEQALTQAGATPVFSCANQACGPAFPVALFTGTVRTASYRAIDMYNQRGDQHQDYRYWIGKLERPTGPLYIGLYVTTRLTQPSPIKIALDIVEPKAQQTGQVVLNADALAAGIQATGRVVIEGLHFAHDQAVLEDASAPALNEIATFLRRHPSARVYIVGHTDGAGGHDHNLRLSQARAETVTRALVSQFRIAADRLIAMGVGAAAPVMGNDTEPGRALNRRVEMVLAGTAALK